MLRNRSVEIVASNVRAEMARRGRTQSQLANCLGVTRPAVSRRLTGQTEFSAGELIETARFLGVPVSTFFELVQIDGVAS